MDDVTLYIMPKFHIGKFLETAVKHYIVLNSSLLNINSFNGIKVQLKKITYSCLT